MQEDRHTLHGTLMSDLADIASKKIEGVHYRKEVPEYFTLRVHEFGYTPENMQDIVSLADQYSLKKQFYLARAGRPG
jgi:hypothetical protein